MGGDVYICKQLLLTNFSGGGH